MSLEDKLTKIRDNPKLQGQQQVHDLDLLPVAVF
jgi:hypothetical protein